MTRIIVDTLTGVMTVEANGMLCSIRCSIGKGSAVSAAEKREGDGATPLGLWPIRRVLFRPDRASAPEGLTLPWAWIEADDGWSDDAADPAYNTAVKHPHPFSAERLVRDDGLYDVIVVLGYNDDPPVPARGSAIFLHCWNEGKPTEGCVAVAKAELLAILPDLAAGDAVEII
ncbi:L,D-transpeptidase family protein [Sphingomonas sp. ID0503]|uniref:L,D-transpeptidase family protein n=1 Tax=Sphingomonas sp. ID0503 TaxID=3399691 RepID=UPI003AFA5C41